MSYLKREAKISLHHETIYRLIYKDKKIAVIYGNILGLRENRILNAMEVMSEEEKLKIESVLIIAQNLLIKSNVLVIGKEIP